MNCAIWIGPRNLKGYGGVWLNGKRWLVHRLAWTIERGAIPSGLCVLHRCDNPACFNTEHLFLGTIADNHRDMREKRRDWQAKRTHCPSGHPYSAENTYRNSSGRHCRECRRAYWSNEEMRRKERARYQARRLSRLDKL